MQAFSESSTSTEVLAGQDLSGKTALITGATSGLGLETAKSMADKGANIIIAARNQCKIDTAIEQLKQQAPESQLSYVLLELSDLDSVRHAAEELLKSEQKIDYLINNAGVMACPFEKTAQGFEMQFGSNHLGHFLFTCLLIPLITPEQGSRIVCLSSAAHKFANVDLEDANFSHKPYDKWQAYGAAKSANALFALELNERVKHLNIEAFSVHPGMIATELGRHLDADDLKMLMGPPKRQEKSTQQSQTKTKKSNPFKTVAQGAATSVWAATHDSLTGKGGCYLEDCQLAEAAASNPSKGYSEHIADPETAKALWTLSEKLVQQTFARF